MSRWEDLQRPMPHPAAVAPTASQAQCKYQFLPSYLVTCLSLQERLEPEQRLGSHGLSTQETLSAHSAPAAVLRALSPISLSPRLTSHLLSVPSFLPRKPDEGMAPCTTITTRPALLSSEPAGEDPRAPGHRGAKS